MSKVITSPVKRFPGTVTLSDPLTFPQSFVVEDALAARRELGEDVTLGRVLYAFLPGILACVEEWNLGRLPPRPSLDNFPRTPGDPVAELIGWLIGEITALYQESEDVPLA